jgi:competence protein ComEC
MMNFVNISLARPLIPLTISLAIGIILAEYTKLSTTHFITMFVIICIITAISLIKKSSKILVLFWVCLLSLATGGTLHSKNLDRLKIEPAIKELNGKKAILRGIVASLPSRIAREPAFLEEHPEELNIYSVFLLDVKEINVDDLWKPLEVRAKVNLYEIDHHVKIGDSIEVSCKIRIPEGPTNPGQPDYSRYLRVQGITLLLTIYQKDTIKIIKQGSYWKLQNIVENTRGFLRNVIYNSLDKETGAYISALLLGFKEEIPRDLNTLFRRTGTAHILAISGLHLAIVLAIFYFLLLFAGIRGTLQHYILLAGLLSYATLTGGQISVLRAGLMASIYIFGQIIWRKKDIANAIFLSAIILLIFNTFDLFNIGFQLSYLAVLAIIYISPIFHNFLEEEDKLVQSDFSLHSKILYIIRKYIYGGIAISISCWLLTAPIMLANFNIVTPCVIVANLLLLPFITLQIGAGLVLIFLGLISSACAFAPAIFIKISFLLIKEIAIILTQVPFSYVYLPTPPIWLIVTFFSLIIMWKLLNISSRFKITFVAFLVITLGLPFLLNKKTDGLLLTMLDVGRGSCVYVEYPDGKNIIYDCGSRTYRDVGYSITLPYLLGSRRIAKVDLLILSHPDTDHINGIESLLERVKVKKIVVSKFFLNYTPGPDLINFIIRKGIPILLIDPKYKLPVDLTEGIKIVGPPDWDKLGHRAKDNDTSLIVKITYGNISVLLTGDMETKEAQELMQTGIDIRSRILIAPHHGKLSENFQLLAETIMPDIVLVSATEDYYSHLVISKYKELGAKVYITSCSGAVILKIINDKIEVTEYNRNKL